MPLPGAKVPPPLTVVPTMPVPPRVPPLLTVTVELASVPFTSSEPALTTRATLHVGPGQRPGAVAHFLKNAKTLILRRGPIVETSKLLLAAPPSRNVSAVLKATTLPVM